MLIEGSRIFWGTKDAEFLSSQPIGGLPPDTLRYRVRVRTKSMATVLVKTARGLWHFALVKDKDGKPGLGWLIAQNQKWRKL